MKVKEYKSGDINHRNTAVKNIPITRKYKPHVIMRTRDGLVTYKEWLESEKSRIEAKGGHADIIAVGEQIQLIRCDTGIYDTYCVLRYNWI